MALTKISRSLLDTGISDSSDATAITIDSSENVFVGSGTSNGISDGTSGLQVSGAGFKGTISASRHDNNAYGSALMLGKSRNTTVGSNTIIQNGDAIGAIGFFADDGTNLDSQVAYITASVDGTPGANDTPGRLTFSTTADGAASVSERMRIDSSGNVGIGTTSPETKVEISGSADNGLLQALQITNTDHASGETGQKVAINFKLSRSGTMRDAGRITANKSDDWDSTSNVDSYLSFDTALNDTRAEKMRLDENGKLTLLADAGYIGDDSSGILQLRTHSTAGGWGISARNYTNTTTGYWYIGKMTNGTNIFSMTSDSDSIDLNFLSDERMKMNITDSADVLDKVKQITVKDFDWRTELNGDTKDNSRPSKEYGFIAQNFQDIGLGQYVKELMPTDESDDTLGMDYGNITPILVKAIQEQQTQIEALQSEINTLKGE